MDLEELNIYNLAMELGNNVWATTENWNFFNKDTIGKQLVRSADSVAANISEGYGRFSYKETVNFAYYSRGSLYETKTWLTKAHQRNLLDNPKYETLMLEIKDLGIKLNNYITTIKSKTNKK